MSSLEEGGVQCHLLIVSAGGRELHNWLLKEGALAVNLLGDGRDSIRLGKRPDLLHEDSVSVRSLVQRNIPYRIPRERPRQLDWDIRKAQPRNNFDSFRERECLPWEALATLSGGREADKCVFEVAIDINRV